MTLSPAVPRLALLVLALLLLSPAAFADGVPDGFFSELKYRYIGPAGNRVPAVVGVPGDPNVYYAGSASGGIFKTVDGGAHWEPIFDDTPASSIGSLAVASSDSNVVWAGTGETFIRSNVSIGDGIYRSLDAGKTWENRGLGESGRIGRVVIDPRDADVVFAAALGHLYGPQEERGVYRTRDGGETWERMLFVDENTGAIDIAMDPNNPRILFAATWQMEMSTSGRTSGGPGSGIFVSRDGGDSWTRLEGNGLPESPWGKIGLAMSADDSERVYALIETSSNRDFEPVEEFAGVLWRSDDGGEKWKMVNADNTLTQRPLYYTRAVAAPDDANEITFLAVEQSISHDGGKSIEEQRSGWDHHDMWIDPEDPDRRIVGHDGGVSISLNRGKSWEHVQLANAQMYRVTTDDRAPYFVYGNRQDGASARGPSNTLSGGEIPVGAWKSVGGCETGFAMADLADPNLVWSGCYDGILELHDLTTGHSRDVSVWPEAFESRAADDLDFRIQWTAPLAASTHEPGTVYYGSQFVHRSRDHGQTWEVISPDLTTDDPELQKRTGGLTLDDAGPTLAPTVFSITESPLEAGVIWAGTNDGQVQVTRDGGESWSNVTESIPDLPPLGTVTNVEPSRHATGRAYVSVDRHQEGDTATYVYATEDYGATWTNLAGDLPHSVFGYAHCVREDPVAERILFLGTENALWVSLDRGASWASLQSNLPPAPVYWLDVQEAFSDLVVATYGRGFWILDDLTPLRELGTDTQIDAPHLFSPRRAYRFRSRGEAWSDTGSPSAGKNPEYGATLHYSLPDKASEAVELVIRNAEGEEIRRLKDLSKDAGLHRVVWNLRKERTTEVKLRTKPDENPKVPIPEKEWRRLSDGGRFALLVPPGTYTAELIVGEETIATTSVEVVRDPGSAGTEADIETQMETLTRLDELISEAAEMINEIEWVRLQMEDLRAARGRFDEDDEEAVSALWEEMDGLEAEIEDIEGAFFDLRLTGARQDTLRWARLLYARLTYLARRIAQVDLQPTEAQLGVFRKLNASMAEQRERWQRVLAEDLPAFNLRAAEAGFGVLSFDEEK